MHSQINMQYNFIKWYTFDTDLPKSAPLHRWPFALHFPNIVYIGVLIYLTSATRSCEISHTIHKQNKAKKKKPISENN